MRQLICFSLLFYFFLLLSLLAVFRRSVVDEMFAARSSGRSLRRVTPMPLLFSYSQHELHSSYFAVLHLGLSVVTASGRRV